MMNQNFNLLHKRECLTRHWSQEIHEIDDKIRHFRFLNILVHELQTASRIQA
jgi:hypothetical protein